MNDAEGRNKVLRIFLIGDSLAVPRSDPSGDIRYRNCYPFLIQQYLENQLQSVHVPVIYDRSQSCCTLPDVVFSWNEEISLQEPDILIIQVGVVDCAPRVFTPYQRKVVANLRPRIMRESVLSLVRKYRKHLVRLRGNLTYTSYEQFRQAAIGLSSEADRVGLLGCYFVNIITPSLEMERRSPGFCSNVAKYNEVLEEVADGKIVQIVDMDGIVQRMGHERLLLSDGIHINKEGHRILAGEISGRIGMLLSGVS